MSYFVHKGYIEWYSLYFFVKKSIKMLKKYLTLQVFNGIIYLGGEEMDEKKVLLAIAILKLITEIVKLISTYNNRGK